MIAISGWAAGPFRLAPNLHERTGLNIQGTASMLTDMAGFFIGLALTLTLMVAIADMDVN